MIWKNLACRFLKCHTICAEQFEEGFFLRKKRRDRICNVTFGKLAGSVSGAEHLIPSNE